MDNAIEQILWSHDLVHTDDGWIMPLQQVLRNVSESDAVWKPRDDDASIAEITAHALNWLRVMTFRLCDMHPDQNEDWPHVDANSEEVWERIRVDLDQAAADFRAQVAALPPETLFAPLPDGEGRTQFKRIMAILVHNAYHAGQIAKMLALKGHTG